MSARNSNGFSRHSAAVLRANRLSGGYTVTPGLMNGPVQLAPTPCLGSQCLRLSATRQFRSVPMAPDSMPATSAELKRVL